MSDRNFLLLGANGDILIALPALRWHAEQLGQPVNLVVDVNYEGLLDGVSYVHPVVSPNRNYKAVGEGRRWAARMGYRNVRILQAGACDIVLPKEAHSYAEHIRARCDVPAEVWSQPLVIDQRNPQREAELVAGLNLDDRPLVLFSGQGRSSPFSDAPLLLEKALQWVPDAQVVDISLLRCTRLYDLLALYERACCLLTIDTATLHLAAACPELPVVALLSDRYGQWSASVVTPAVNLSASVKYSEWAVRESELSSSIQFIVANSAPNR